MNALSATTVFGASAAATLAGALILATLSRPMPLRPLSEQHSLPIAPFGAVGLLPAAPMLDDCAPFAPADPALDLPRSLTLRAAASGDDVVQPGAAANPGDPGCDPDGAGAEVGGLGSGWIISADGVMQMDPYSLSDTHSIAVRPAEPLLEFKGRVIGLGGPGPVPRGAQPAPERNERRPLLVVRADDGYRTPEAAVRTAAGVRGADLATALVAGTDAAADRRDRV